jgi:uncharacterized protein (DUF433 family)
VVGSSLHLYMMTVRILRAVRTIRKLKMGFVHAFKVAEPNALLGFSSNQIASKNSDFKMRYTTRMNLLERITITPDVRSGKPCIAGTRITVYDILEYLAGGMTEAEILADFPSLTQDDLRAVLAFAALRERCLASMAA